MEGTSLNTCRQCDIEVVDSDDALECENCDRWFHIKCKTG